MEKRSEPSGATSVSEEKKKDFIDRYVAVVERLLQPRKRPVIDQDAPRYADFGTRIFASTVDMALSLILVAPFLQLFSNLIFFGQDIRAVESDLQFAKTPGEFIAILSSYGVLDNIIVNYVLQTVALAVIVYFFWVHKAATPGKMLLRLRIVDADTLGIPTRKQYQRRLLGYIVAGMPFFLGFFAMAWNERKQGWHDRMANTVVLQGKWRWPWKKDRQTEPPSESIPAASSEPAGPAA